jgi:hypothetical protein
MQNELNKLNGKSFKYCGKIYTVKETKIVNGKAAILTNGQTFIKSEVQLKAFIEDIEFVKKETIADDSSETKAISAMQLLKQDIKVFNAEVLAAETVAQKLSNKLMEVFDSLSDKPDEATYKKASAMVQVSNSIVNIQVAQIKFLSLKK